MKAEAPPLVDDVIGVMKLVTCQSINSYEVLTRGNASVSSLVGMGSNRQVDA